jgi:hypothetical protein
MRRPGAVLRTPCFRFRVILALCHRGRNVLVKISSLWLSCVWVQSAARKRLVVTACGHTIPHGCLSIPPWQRLVALNPCPRAETRLIVMFNMSSSCVSVKSPLLPSIPA